MRIRCLFAAAILAGSLAAQSPLTTTFNSSTFLAASGTVVYFDLNVRSGVQINQLDVNFYGVANLQVYVDVWVRNGTHVGNNTSNSGWTLAGTSLTAASAGRNVPTPMTFASPIVLQPGLHGIAVQHWGTGAAYTAGTSVGNLYASTAEMDFLEGGSANPPIFVGTQNAPRVMNCSIHYTPLGGFASATPYGSGCGGVSQHSSYYQNFGASAFDLGGSATTARTLYHTTVPNSGYVVLPGGNNWYTPTSPNLNLADESVSAAQPLGFTFTLPNGTPTTSIYICDNGYIWLTAPGIADFTPAANELLSQGPRLCPLWISLRPTSGSIHFDSDPTNGVAYVTWLQVPENSASGADVTMQVALYANGDFEYRYGAETIGSLSTTFALVGYSPGNGALDPGNTDISNTVPIITAPDLVVPDMALGSTRPVEGQTMTVNVSDIPQGTVVGVLVAGFQQILPGLQPIPGLGTCVLLAGLQSQILFLPTGNTHSLNLPIPVGVVRGLTFHSQVITLTPGINPAGVASSNGLSWTIDVN